GFELADVSEPGAKSVFDRTFDSDDVAGFGEIDLLQQRGHGGRLAATGGTAEQDKSMQGFDQLLQVGMEVELFDGGLEGREQANGEANPARGVQDVDAAAHALNRFGQIARAALDETRPLVGRDERARHFQNGLGGNRLAYNAQSAANAHGRREAWFEMQVAGALFLGAGDQRCEIHQ